MTRREMGRPIVVSPDLRDAIPLERIDLAGQLLKEDWLQQLVSANPEILPIDDFDPSFGPLIPIGREVPSGAGPIDVLFISPSATLTVVETKLWRNPEARRQVVGQILDYAAALSKWSYERLDRTCHQFRSRSLWELVKDEAPIHGISTEAAFVDAASRNLRLGRFLLLIAGDGIREGVERMVDFVQTQPQLQFTLGLVELKVFDRPGTAERLVVPSVVARTAEVTRAVVEVAVSPDNAQVEVDVSVPLDGGDAVDGPPLRASIDRFFNELGDQSRSDDVEFARSVVADFATDPRLIIEPKRSSLMIKRRRLTAGAPHLTLLGIRSGGEVFIGWLGQQLPRNGVDQSRARDYAAGTAQITGANVHSEFFDTWDHGVALSQVRDVWPRLREYMLEFVDSLDPGVEE